MEGPQNLKLNPHLLTKSDQLTLVIIVIAFHFVGLLGFYASFSHGLFLMLVPWHLLLMLAVVGGSHRPADVKFLLFTVTIYLTAFFIEWEGVNAQLFFGSYSYGPTLGTQIDGVPLCIGVNWFLLVYSTGIVMQRSRVRSKFARVLFGAMLLVLLDILIEPVAVKFDYWSWKDGIIPLKNYVSWFLVSGVMLFVFELFKFKKQGIVAPVFLLVQFVFFAVLFLTVIFK